MNGMNPVINGLTAAMSLAGMFQRMSLEREHLERAKKRDQRETELTNFQTQLGLLNAGARPVDATGTYDANIMVPDVDLAQAMADPTKAGLRNKPMATKAPIDRNRVVKAPGGNEYYVPTKQENFTEDLARDVARTQALTDVTSQARIAEAQAKFNQSLMLEDLRQTGANTRTILGIEGRANEGEANRKNQRDITEFRENNANRRNERTNATSSANSQRAAASRIEAANIRNSGGGNTRREVNGRDEEIVKLENRASQLKRWLKDGKAVDKSGKEVELSKSGWFGGRSNQPALQEVAGELAGINRRIRMLRRQNEGAELTSGGGTWDDFKTKIGGKK